MKFLKYTFALLAAAALAGCSDNEDGPKLDHDTPLYLSYQVDLNHTAINAFATFTAYGPEGDRVKLNNGAEILCNTTEMYYSGDGSKEGEYDYFRQVLEFDTRVVFTFTRRKGVSNTTIVDTTTLPDFRIGDELSEMKNDVLYPFAPAGDQLGLTQTDYTRIEATLISGDGAQPNYYPCVISGGMLSISGVPTGSQYVLKVIKYAEHKITPDDACAGGLLVMTRTVTKNNITITE